jgi:hypothetical protein
MGSIVAGSTYLLAPPAKSSSHRHLIASILCHPIAHPHLLLQLQRKDPDTRHALPQFDLVSRKSGRRIRSVEASELPSSGSNRRLREVVVQHSETGEKAATIKYVDSMTSTQKRKAGIAPDDDTTIAVIYWHYAKSLVKVWTVHRYQSKRRGNKVGYEFRLLTPLVRGANGQGTVYVRWTKKLFATSSLPNRPSSVSSRPQRSSSVSSSEGPRRRHTFPSQDSYTVPVDPKWDFSSPNVRRVMASMTSQKLQIHSISSSGTPLSSPSTSDVDEGLRNDRELTTGRMFEMLIVSGLFVGLEEDFASKLRKEFLSAGGLRIPQSDEVHTLPDEPVVIPRKPRSINTPKSPVESRSTSPIEVTPPRDSEVLVNKPKDISLMALRPATSILHSNSYAARGWGYMTGAAFACVSKLLNLGA